MNEKALKKVVEDILSSVRTAVAIRDSKLTQNIDNKLADEEFDDHVRVTTVIIINAATTLAGDDIQTRRKMEYRGFSIREKPFGLRLEGVEEIGNVEWGIRYLVGGFPGARLRYFRTPGEAVEYIDNYLDFSNIDLDGWRKARKS